jgi:hypothetical protein
MRLVRGWRAGNPSTYERNVGFDCFLRRPGRPAKNGGAPDKEKEKQRREIVLAVLKAISNASHEGADSAVLVKAGGVSDGKALGPIMAMTNRVIEKMQLDVRAVYHTSGFAKKKRWIPESQITAAIKKLEEK